jgi:hypothetical protein
MRAFLPIDFEYDSDLSVKKLHNNLIQINH